MAKKTYVGVNNIARNVSKMYVGVNGVARKVKKAYVGVNGVARQFYRKVATSVTKISGGLNFSYGMSEAITAQNNDYVVFNGDSKTSASGSASFPQTVNAFDKNLTRSVPTSLYGAENNGGAGISFSNHACLIKTTYINSYDSSLTRTVHSITHQFPSGTTTPPIATTMGDNCGIMMDCAGYLVAYNPQFTETEIGRSVADTRKWWDPESCTSFSNKSYFFDLGNPASTNYCSINQSLTLTNEGSYSTYSSAVHRVACGATDDYVFCVGGMTEMGNYNSSTANGFAIDKNGTKIRTSITNVANSFGGASSDDFFVCGGGRYTASSATKSMYRFDNSVTRTNVSQLDYNLVWNYGNAYWKGYFIFHNGRDQTNSINHINANLYQEQFN